MSKIKSLTYVLLLFVIFFSGLIYAQDKPKDNANKLNFKGLTFQPGYRIQTRYTYDFQSNIHDIMLRRVRLKGKGDAFGIAKYYVEIKIDNVAQEGKTPKAKAESVFLDFKLRPALNIRIGQYDVPFTRSLLTSDSKLLFMNRSIITNKLAKFGLVDNTQGLLIFGRPHNGRFEYSFGIFDNEVFEKSGSQSSKWTKNLMPAGRFVLNLWDSTPKDGGYADYKASYIGKGKRLAIGVNGVTLSDVHEDTLQYTLSAFGADIYANYEAISFEAEYDSYKKEVSGFGWYVQSGYVLPFESNDYKLEPAVRYQEFDPNKDAAGDKSTWYSFGLNIYLKGHNLKTQLDYTVKKEETNEVDNNTFQVQLQLDF